MTVLRWSTTLARWSAALALLVWSWLWIGLPAVGMLLGVKAAPTVALSQERQDAPVTITGSRTAWGACYRESVGAITHVHLAGSPSEIGWGLGRLAGDRITALEGDLVGVFTERVPWFPLRHLLLGLVNANNRTLAAHYRSEELAEIAASTAAHGRYFDAYRAMGPSWSRGLQYHALHDISQYLIDSPLVQPIAVGCTAVALGPSRVALGPDRVALGPDRAGGHWLVGRLFDFEGGARFDLDKIVYTVAPDRGHRFVHVCWAGMSGAVTGLNDAGLWVSINAAATDARVFVGRPVVLAVREILQHADGIDAALDILKKTPVFVSDAVLLVSAREGRAVVAEKGPGGFGVRAMTDDQLIVTNHFIAPTWSADQANADRLAHGTTAKRWARVEELLAGRTFDPPAVAALLRDRHGPAGKDLGFSNRGTINAWIGCHLAVCDVTAGVLWVSEPRHGLGAMRAFTVDGPVDLPPIAADPDLERCAQDQPRWLAACAEVKALLRGGLEVSERAAAEAQIATILRLNPEHFESLWLAGLVARDPAERRRWLESALAAQPAYPADAERIRQALGELP